MEAGLTSPEPSQAREIGGRNNAIFRPQRIRERAVVRCNVRDEYEAHRILGMPRGELGKMQIHLASADCRVQVGVFLPVGNVESQRLVEFQRLVERTTWEQGNHRFTRLSRGHTGLLLAEVTTTTEATAVDSSGRSGDDTRAVRAGAAERPASLGEQGRRPPKAA